MPNDEGLDPVIQSELESKRARLQVSLAGAVAVNPDDQAKHDRISTFLNQPRGVTAIDPVVASRQAAIKEVANNSAPHPILRNRYSTDKAFADLAHDDSSVLSNIANAVKQMLEPPRTFKKAEGPQVLTNAQLHENIVKIRAGNPVLGWEEARNFAVAGNTLDNTSVGVNESQRPQATLGNLVSGLGANAVESLIKSPNAGLSRMSADLLGLPSAANEAKKEQDRSASRQFLGVPKIDNTLGDWAYRGVNSTVQQLPGLVASVATGSPAPLLASMGLTTTGSAYGKYRDRGGSVGESMLGSIAEGVLEAGTELIPMKFLTDKIGKMGVGQFARNFFGRELASEEVNTVLSNAVDTAIANPNKTWGEYLKELPKEMAATAVQTLVQTGLLTGGHAALRRTVMRAQASEYQAQQAEQMAQGLETLQKTAMASKLLDRSPATLTAYMQDLADQGVPNIHVDSAKLVEAGVDMQKLAALVPSISGQLDQVATGGDLVIPTAELLVNTIGTEFSQPLIDNARSGPSDMSRAEAKDHMASKGDALNAEIERVLAEKADDDTFKEGRDALQTKLQEQLNSLGRFTPAVNKNHAMWVANFYSVMAARAGMEPQAFADRYALGFSTTGNTQGNVLEQQHGISVEGYHYSKSELNSASSAYYGTGLKGSAREANLNATDVRLRKRTSFYVDKGTGINPEAGVGGYAHRAQLSNLYDANSDPLRLRKGGQQAFESAVLDHGFSGYLDRLDGTQSGHAILLGNQTTPLEKLGSMGKTKGAVVAAPAPRLSLGRDKVVDALNADKDLVGGTVARWQERLAKAHPDALTALTDAGVFEGDQNRQLYKSELLNEFEQKTEAPVYSQGAVAADRYQARAAELLVAHTPDKRSAVAYMGGSADAPLLPTNFDIAKFFTKKHKGELSTRKLIDALYSDTLQALAGANSAVGWYDAKVREALTTMAEVHPEIATDPQAKFGFITMLAITSNSTDVNTNFKVAEAAYRSWKETGKWPTENIPDAKAAEAMRDGFKLIESLVAQHGWEKVRDFMVGDQTRADVEAFAGRSIASELAGSKIYGAVFLGSKVGAFFNNLYGNFTPVTMDRWFMRTINRVRGGMLKLPDSFGSNLARLAEQLENGLEPGSVSGLKLKAEIGAYNALPKDKKTDVLATLKVLPLTLSYARDRFNTYVKGTVDSAGKHHSFSPRTAENVLAKTIFESLTLDEQTPEGGADREHLRGVMRGLQDRLKADGIPIEMADLQAVLWYYEKDLFDLLKGKNRQASMFGEPDKEAEDYATAAKRVVEQLRGSGAGKPGSVRPGKQPVAQRDSGQTTLFQSEQSGREADGSLKGLPRNIEGFDPSVYEVAAKAAEAYVTKAGLPYSPPVDYVKVDKARAKRIADAFDAMAHDPQNPEVKAAYQAMIDETLAQYEAILATGLKIEFNGAEDPYHGNPRNMTEDVRKNNHMWVFSTRDGFGSDAAFDPMDNPLLAETKYKFGDQPALTNDIFRAVHDYFGHVKEGVGFRADGEENAWRSHASMYSPQARRAMTTETRGQNSWLNYGPHGDTNRTAKVEDTHFADQKIGLLPLWVSEEGSGQRVEQTETPAFKAWFEGSKVVDAKGSPLVVYHGTNSDAFSTFNPNLKNSDRDTLAESRLSWFSNADFANQWVEDALLGSRMFDDDYAYGSAERLNHKIDKGLKKSPYLMSAYLKVQNPLDLTFFGNVLEEPTEDFVVFLGARLGLSAETVDEIQEEVENLDTSSIWDGPDKFDASSLVAVLQHPEVQDAFERSNFDGIKAEENGEIIWGVKDGTQIKSALGNNGNFDPTNPSILEQQARGQIAFSNDITQQASIISLFKNADLSTFVHESGHFFLEVHADLAGKIEARGAEATPGEQSLLADFSKTLNWLGVKPTPEQSALQVWFEMSPEQKRPLHEQWARGFEAYTFEGKAPSLELQPLFQTFRAWLVNVYRSVLKSMSASKTDVGNALDVELSDEVRGVMDRMVATSDQIAESEAARNLGPLFKTAEEAGMSMAEYQAYHNTGLQATFDATDELQARSMRDMQWLQNARSRKIKEMQKQHDVLRSGVAAEVKAELMAQPVYRAWAFLTSKSDDKLLPGVASDIDPNIGAGKLRTQYLRDAYGEADDAIWRRLSDLRMTSDVTGLDPDHVAELFGFDSGDALAKALHDAEEPKHAIQGLTDTRMLQEHGDLAHPAGVERAADMAIHNEVRARFVATELKALQNAMSVREKVPGRRNTVDALAAAAKEYAYATIAKLKVRDLHPAQYAAAEVRASKAAQKALGDTNKAAMFKRNQLINMAATKEAYAAQEEVKKAVEYFRGFDAPSKTIDPEYSQQIEALLERFDLRQSTTLKDIDKRASLLEWVQSQTEQGMEPDIPQDLLNEANRKSFKEMTVDEVRGLRDTIKQIEHLGRLKNHLLTAKANRIYNEAVAEIVDSINLHADGRTADVRTPNTVLGGALLGLKNFWASHIKAATWARVMDGGKDGGPVWEYLIRTANDAGNTEVVAREAATKALTVLMAPVLKEGKMGGKGVMFPTINRSLNKEARIGMYLNMGNESNFQRLLGGEGWTRQQVQPVLDAMTPAEHTFVQAVWDHFESYRPAIAAKETRIYGREPTWLVPTPLETPHGELRGGYYPVKYDPRASERAESHAEAETAKQQLAGAYTSATTRRSFTKARVEEVSGRPLLYSLDGMYSGVSEVLHDLAWHEWLIDANKLMKSKRISSAIRTQYGPEVHQQLKQWLVDNATGDRAAAGANEKALAYIRQGVSISGLGLNVMSALVQPFGITQSFVRVGPKWVGRGLVKFIGSPLETADTVNEKSDFMRTRVLTRLREISELRSQVKGRTPARAAVEASAYFLMMRAQQLVDVPTWWGAYEKAVSEGNNEERAVALSDQAVIDAQGSGGIKDQSAIERGGPAIKLFTTFYSFFNTALNLGVQKTMNSESKAKLAADYLLLYVVPVILVAAMKDALTPGDSGDWDDPEKLRKKLASEEIQYLFGLMFGVRELSGFAQAATGTGQYPTDYSGPAGVRMLADLAKLGKQIGQGELDDGLRKSLISVGGELLRLPSAQINRTITGINALRDGDTENWGAILTGFQKPH